jgi:hypothetical protein
MRRQLQDSWLHMASIITFHSMRAISLVEPLQRRCRTPCLSRLCVRLLRAGTAETRTESAWSCVPSKRQRVRCNDWSRDCAVTRVGCTRREATAPPFAGIAYALDSTQEPDRNSRGTCQCSWPGLCSGRTAYCGAVIMPFLLGQNRGALTL